MCSAKKKAIKNTNLDLKGLRARADRCARCGACLSFCPVYQAVRIERFSPRGKNYLLLSAPMKRRQKLIRKTVSACLQCGACSKLCSSGTDVASLIRKMRQEMSYFRPLPSSLFEAWDKLGQEKSLKAVSYLECLGNFMKDFTGRIVFSQRPFLSNLDHYSRLFTNSQVLSSFENKGERPRILLFTGCVQNFVYPEKPAKMASLFNWDISIPEGQICCGLPAYSQGALRQARSFARKNLELFLQREFDVILTGCASCAYMIKNWPLLFEAKDVEYLDEAKRASERVVELSQFIKRYDFTPIVKKGPQVTIQIPCHQRFGLDSPFSSRSAVKKIAANKSNLTKQNLGCCGLGGTFSILNPDISKTIFEQNVAQKILQPTFNKESWIITTCSGCLLRLEQGLREMCAGTRRMPKAAHLVDLMVEG